MIITTPGVVIKRYKIGEADRFILVFSRKLGKILAVAKSVRRPTSKLAGHLEPYTETNLELAETRGSYFRLVGAQNLSKISASQKALSLKIIRLLDILGETVDLTLGEAEPNVAAYQTFSNGVQRIQENQQLADLIATETLVKLLADLGFRPELDFCTICRMRLTDQSNAWSSFDGGVVCHRCQRKIDSIRPLKSSKTLSLLRLMQSEADLADRITASQENVSEANQLIIDYLLTHLPRPLKSIVPPSALSVGLHS